MEPVKQDRVRLALRRLIDQRGVDMATVSRAIGKNHAYVQQYLNRGVPTELGYKAAMALSEFFGVSPELFGINAGAQARPSNDRGREPLVRHPLQAIRRLIGLDTAQMAKALGEKETLIDAVEKGREPLNEKLMLKLCRTFRIDPADLAGYAPALSPEERVTLLRLRGLSTEQRSAVDDLIADFEKERA